MAAAAQPPGAGPPRRGRLDIVAGLTPVEDGPQGHLTFVRRAVALGYGRVWLPETSLVDPVAVAGWLAATTPQHPLGLGVLPAALRSGPQLAMMAATLTALGVQDVVLAVGASSPVVVRRWHGRTPTSVAAMEALVAEARQAASGERTAGGFVNGLGAVALRLHVAALGPRMLALAAQAADGVALNFIGPEALGVLLAELDAAAGAVGRERPTVTVWAHATVEPDERDVRAARRWLAAYLTVPGYERVLRLQGFEAAVAAAGERRRRPAEAAELIDDRMLAVVAGFGTREAVQARIGALLDHGVDVALIPGAVRPGEATARTLEALAPLATADIAPTPPT